MTAFTASYVLLWALVVAQAIIVMELLRQIGILRLRVGEEQGALLMEDGLQRGTVAPPIAGFDLTARAPFEAAPGTRRRLLVFLTPRCHSCREIAQHLNEVAYAARESAEIVAICNGPREECAALARDLELTVPVVLDAEQHLSQSYKAERTPSAVLVDEQGHVLLQATPNTKRHLEHLLEEEASPMLGKQWLLRAQLIGSGSHDNDAKENTDDTTDARTHVLS